MVRLETKTLMFDAMKPAINPRLWQVRGLTKRLTASRSTALDLTVRTGDSMRLLAQWRRQDHDLAHGGGLLRPDAGTVSVLGIDALSNPVAAKQDHGLVSDEPMIYDKLTPLNISNSLPPLGHRSQGFRTSARELLVSPTRAASATSPLARDFPRACARRWRSRAGWCTIPG